MSRTPAAYLFFPAIAAVAAGLTFGLHYARDHWLNSSPVLFYSPHVIELGSLDQGETVLAHFSLHNVGNRELVVNQFTTSCSCAGVERDDNGKPIRVESVHVPRGGTADLFVRVTINSAIGDSQSIQVFFRSNDPVHPVGQVDIFARLVTGGVCASPCSVVFYSLPAGQPSQQLVELYDAGALGRRVARARSLQPERFGVRVLPVDEDERGTVGGAEQVLIARLEVTARTERPGPLDGEIEVDVVDEKRPPFRIPVTGEVVSAVEHWPRTMILPRRVGGRTVFGGELALRSRDAAPLDVRLLSAPAWLRVDIREVAGHQDQRTVFVEGNPDSPRHDPDSSIRLLARSGSSSEETVIIPVTVAELPP